ncbi:MAG TPA: type III pantothenate kinase [Actinobacteria bacterium]|nr:type III pantothenate kinase [Actinomycetota bacterium]
MLLAIDVGNTQTAVGVFDDAELVHQWRLSSVRERTKDEFQVLVRGLLEPAGYSKDDFEGAAISSVVPAVTMALQPALEDLIDAAVMVVGPGLDTGLAVLIDNPAEVGADRVVNSVAALEKYGAPVLVVDFGTATTFDVVNPDGAYVGGAIAPGLEVSMDALITATAALRRVDLVEPRSVVGKSTVEAIQSGLLYGYAGLVDGIVRRIFADVGSMPTVATGGIAPTMAPLCETVDHLDSALTLDGLRLLFDRSKE